ncbi:MAG: glutamate-1-semialdehyde-2,1-aminomutase [Clostridiales bacterium]|nr:MAG: glutamate-1-semialdehyde-2,1-aminomutase [Clostridiales bacterium]
MQNNKSKTWFEKASKVMPGGVNSPVRAYRSVDLTPPFISSAKGSKIRDIDGNEYIDYVSTWGPAILGHAHPDVIEEVKNILDGGTSFGAPTVAEVRMAEMICEAVTSVEMIRMVSSGTEAVMSAIRVARGYTGRDLIVKFDGCYHGHSDGLLVKAGSGLLTYSSPDSSGVPSDYAKNTLIVPYNDIEALREVFEKYGTEIAAIVVEPVAANMGVIVPKDGFLKGLRKLADDYGSVLIFDEVITGFRLSYGGAQEYFGVEADLTIFGKIIGGGLPVGAYGGKREIMGVVSPLGSVYQAGTLSGNPVATAAGIKTLQILKENKNIYKELEEKAEFLEKHFMDSAKKHNIPLTVNRVGSLFSIFFTDKEVVDFSTASRANSVRFKKYFKEMLERGIYLAPSPYEAVFLSISHSEIDLKKTAEAIEEVFSIL